MAQTDYTDFVARKKKTLEEWYDWEPVGYFKLVDEEISVDLDCKRMARYVCLFPLGFRNDSSMRFNSKNMTCSFFGVSGKENKIEKPLANSIFLANKSSEATGKITVNVYASEKKIYNTSYVPLTVIESNDTSSSYFRSLVSFANPEKESEFTLELELPQNSNFDLFGCNIELHGGLGNFNPSLSKLLEDQNQTKQMVHGFVQKL